MASTNENIFAAFAAGVVLTVWLRKQAQAAKENEQVSADVSLAAQALSQADEAIQDGRYDDALDHLQTYQDLLVYLDMPDQSVSRYQRIQQFTTNQSEDQNA